MIVFDSNSWHYKLILYVWGRNFFLDTSEIDYKKLMALDSTKLHELSWKEFPRLEKPRTVNLCPYCRAIVGSVITFPFVFLWRLFPHKPKKPRTHAETIKASGRQSKRVRWIVAGGMAAFGIYHVVIGDSYLWAVFYFLIAAFNVKSPEVLKWTAKQMMRIKLPKRKPKERKRKSITVTPEFFKKLQKKHDVICPPVYFIDKTSKDLT